MQAWCITSELPLLKHSVPFGRRLETLLTRNAGIIGSPIQVDLVFYKSLILI